MLHLHLSLIIKNSVIPALIKHTDYIMLYTISLPILCFHTKLEQFSTLIPTLSILDTLQKNYYSSPL